MAKQCLLFCLAIIVNGKNLNYFSSFKLKIYAFGVESMMTDFVTLDVDPRANLPNDFTGRENNMKILKYVVKHKSAKLFMTYAVGMSEAALNISHLILSTSSQ